MSEQRTEDWYQARLGKVTASRIGDVMAKTKSGYAASRKNYMAELVAERLTGQPQDSYTSAAMARGTELEEEAANAYAFLHEAVLQESGFVPHQTLTMSGASPDRFVGDLGLVEFKCPNTATHIEFLQTGKIPKKYQLQMQWQMECTGRQWCDYVSYDPRLPEDMMLKCVRIEQDGELLDQVRDEITKFLTEVDKTCESLLSQYRSEATK